ncbi:MAG TPA: hypothetical protein VF170_10230, partial [Planctomycetaceae bacterium]
MTRPGGLFLLAVSTLLVAGCSKSSAPLGGKPAASRDSASDTKNQAAEPGGSATAPAGWKAPEVTEDGKWAGYPHVPYVPVMEEVDGIDVPRVFDPPDDYVAGGEVPVDVHNPAAKGQKTEPVTGGSIAVRFNAEPKTLNPITESSAYQTYITSYTQDALAWQNPETFDWEPFVAKKWIIEDSVKLRPDFPGRERWVATDGGQPAGTIEIEI